MWVVTFSDTGLSCPSTASLVTTTLPGSSPIPPQVPILEKRKFQYFNKTVQSYKKHSSGQNFQQNSWDLRLKFRSTIWAEKFTQEIWAAKFQFFWVGNGVLNCWQLKIIVRFSNILILFLLVISFVKVGENVKCSESTCHGKGERKGLLGFQFKEQDP